MAQRKTRLLAIDHNAVLSRDRGLYRELADVHGVDVSVVVPEQWHEQFGRVAFEPEASKVRAIPSGVFFGGRTHRVLYSGMGAALRSILPDLLLVNSEPEGFAALQAVVLASFMRDSPEVVFETWRNIPYGKGGERFPVRWPWLSARIESFVLRRSAAGVEHSPGGTDAFRNTGFDNITEIPPWVDQQVFSPVSNAAEPRRKTSPYLTIGFIGRFVPEKGILNLLSAVSASGIAARVNLVGDGPQQDELRQFLRTAENPPHTEFIPPVPHPAMPDQLRKLDVVVLPSVERPGWCEQFGRVLIEAMACGVPVVGSSSGAIPSVIGDAGLIVPAGDVHALAQALRRLAENPGERANLAEAGLRRVTSEFSVQVVARKLAVLFNELIERKHRGT